MILLETQYPNYPDFDHLSLSTNNIEEFLPNRKEDAGKFHGKCNVKKLIIERAATRKLSLNCNSLVY